MNSHLFIEIITIIKKNWDEWYINISTTNV